MSTTTDAQHGPVPVKGGLVSYLALEQPLHRSPWLRSFTASDQPAPVPVPEEAPVPAAPAPVAHRAPALPSTRPAGWPTSS